MSTRHDAMPLAGLRILDTSHVFAIPYATSLLAHLGAEVIRIQTHRKMDLMAPLGPYPENDPGERPWDRIGSLNSVNRAKRGLSLDISLPEGANIYRRLVAVSDVVAESFTPRVMKKLGLDYEALAKINPLLIMLSNTGYGHTGPWREYGSVATSLEGTSGMCWLSGYEDGPPSKIGQSYTDFITCWTAAYAILASVYRRNRTKRGQWIDLAMYQAGVSTIGPLVMDYLANGNVPARIGNRHPTSVPHGVFPCQGQDRWIALAIDSDDAWQRLCQAANDAPWSQEAGFTSLAGRMADSERLEASIREWTSKHDALDLASRLQNAGVMASAVENGRDLLQNEQLKARGFFPKVAHGPISGVGNRRYPGIPWQLSGAPTPAARPAPTLGEHNQQILADLLQLSDVEIENLRSRGIIGTEISGPANISPLPLEELRTNRRIGIHDPEYPHY